jgi:predicted enzyme related to lactoylglutathione lyase
VTSLTEASTSAPPLTLARLVILVRDYDAALAFYQAAFGARVLFDGPSPSGDRYLHIGFGPDDADPAARSAGTVGAGIWFLRARGTDDSLVGRQSGGQPLAVFYTADVRAATARVEAAGGTVVRPAVTASDASFSHVTDLYGNELVLVELAVGSL